MANQPNQNITFTAAPYSNPYTFASTSGGVVNISGSVDSLSWTPQCPNHVVGEDLLEYLDGVVVGHCENCQGRIEIPRLPGSVHLLRLRDMVARLVIASDEISYELGEYAEARDAIQAERDALAEADALLEAAARLLRQHGIEP